MDPLHLVTIVTGILGLAALAAGLAALRRRRLIPVTLSTLVALLLLSLAALATTISVATRGYRALTREELAATITTRPLGPRQFLAAITYPDGRTDTYQLAGDQVYVDAHILKWKPIANLLGLHTAYELDRLGGRYLDLDAERDSARTVFSLKRDKPIDMFALRRRFALFRPLLDAEYGSGSFIAADRAARFDLLVSTTGLLLRRAGDPVP